MCVSFCDPVARPLIFGTHSAPAGWEQWSSSTPNTDVRHLLTVPDSAMLMRQQHVFYGEFGNT
jgi:hypothetical protein